MKNRKILVLLGGLFFLFLTACSNAPEGEKVEAKDAQTVEKVVGDHTFEITATSGSIMWEGTKAIGGGHKGHINIQKGNLLTKAGKLVGGSFTIDMNSISDESLQDPGDKANLEGHLKSGDFFDVKNYPIATFEITNVVQGADDKTPGTVTGNLTIKGITKSIKIPTFITIEDMEIGLKTAPFTINRTEWGVKFHSGLLGTPKDKIINDNIGFRIALKASL